MPRVAILNMLIGFVVLSLAAAAGSFVATEATEAILKDPTLLNTWGQILRRSAHGHTNLFAMTHILFGLTLPYSGLSSHLKKWQTIGLLCGTIAMSAGMYSQSLGAGSLDASAGSVIVGILLSAALLAIGSHAFGLSIRLVKPSVVSHL